jgi:aryl-alcohol dehydrogenase-like predicted oxidoreductase
MRYKTLGRTGLYVSELCLGTMTFSGSDERAGFFRSFGQLEQPAVDRMVALALEHGVNFIDTADVYAFGVSESLTGQALRNLGVARSDVVLATKFTAPVGPGPNDRGASRGHLMDSVHASLKRLQTDHIDLYQVHATDHVTPQEETLRALDDLVRQGKVRYTGVSNQHGWRIMKGLGLADRHGWTRYATVQAHASVANRDIEHDIVPLLREEGLGLLVWSPLSGGLLSGKFGPGAPADAGSGRREQMDFPPVDRDRAWACIEQMRAISKARGCTVAQVALAWLLHQAHVTSVIVGARTPEQLRDNLGAAQLTLDDAELALLDAAGRPAPQYPGWMVDYGTSQRVPQPFVPKV